MRVNEIAVTVQCLVPRRPWKIPFALPPNLSFFVSFHLRLSFSLKMGLNL